MSDFKFYARFYVRLSCIRKVHHHTSAFRVTQNTISHFSGGVYASSRKEADRGLNFEIWHQEWQKLMYHNVQIIRQGYVCLLTSIFVSPSPLCPSLACIFHSHSHSCGHVCLDAFFCLACAGKNWLIARRNWPNWQVAGHLNCIIVHRTEEFSWNICSIASDTLRLFLFLSCVLCNSSCSMQS